MVFCCSFLYVVVVARFFSGVSEYEHIEDVLLYARERDYTIEGDDA